MAAFPIAGSAAAVSAAAFPIARLAEAVSVVEALPIARLAEAASTAEAVASMAAEVAAIPLPEVAAIPLVAGKYSKSGTPIYWLAGFRLRVTGLKNNSQLVTPTPPIQQSL